MAKNGKRAKVPKRIAGVKVPKSLPRAGRPVAEFLSTPLGRGLAVDVLVAAFAVFASTEKMRKSYEKAAKRARNGGRGLGELALHLGRAAVLPTLVAPHARLPREVGAERRARSAREGRDGADSAALH